jgi:hypothetical protein
MEDALVLRNEELLAERGRTQKLIMKFRQDLRSDPCKVINDIWSN